MGVDADEDVVRLSLCLLNGALQASKVLTVDISVILGPVSAEELNFFPEGNLPLSGGTGNVALIAENVVVGVDAAGLDQLPHHLKLGGGDLDFLLHPQTIHAGAPDHPTGLPPGHGGVIVGAGHGGGHGDQRHAARPGLQVCGRGSLVQIHTHSGVDETGV